MQDITEVVEARYERLTAGDIPGMLAFYAPKVVQFNLAPPLGGWTEGNDPAPLTAWLTTFGKICRPRMREFDVPTTRAASTYSSRRTTNVSPRTMRA